MTAGNIATLVTALASAGHKPLVGEQYSTIFIENDVFTMWVEPRPDHCDRGRWMWMVQPMHNVDATVDEADMFPRYFFHQECLVMELTTWLKTRMRRVESKRATAFFDKR